MKNRLKYIVPFTSSGFSADFKNTTTGIEISNVVAHGNYTVRSAESARNSILIGIVKPYSRWNPDLKSDRKKIGDYCKELIEKKKKEIEELELLRQIALKNKVEIIKDH